MGHHLPIRVNPRLYELMLNAWGLGLGIATVIGALMFFLLPESVTEGTSISNQLGPWDEAWNLGYGLGGGLMAYGLLARSRGIDALGLCIFAAGLAINALAIFVNAGGKGILVFPTFAALTVAAIMRVLVVAVIVVPSDGPPR